MEQKPETINIKINCTAATTTTAATSSVFVHNRTAGNDKKKVRRPKNWGWPGSKKQRRLAREKKTKKRRFAFYAVHVGRQSDVIYDNWEECEACVKSFPNPVYKGFNVRVGAVDWLREKRTRAAYDKMIQEHERAQTCDTNDDGQTIPTAKATPIPCTIPTATYVPVDPVPPTTTACERDFSAVAELARLIANAPVDGVPPPPKCTNPICPYTCGEVTRMQQILLQRLYQTAILTAQHNYVGKDHKL